MTKFLSADHIYTVSNLVKLGGLGSNAILLRTSTADLLEIRNNANSGPVDLLARHATFSEVAQTGFPILTARAWNVTKRQCIDSGSVDSNGLPNSLTNSGLTVTGNYSATVMRLCFAAGFDQYGPVDYRGQLITQQTFGGALSANTTSYLYCDRNTSTGALTTGRTTLRPLYQRTAPGSPSTDQHWFNTSQDAASSGQTGMRMYRWTGSAWSQVHRVFIGQATTDASTVTQLVSYSYQRRYLSNWLAAVTNTTYNFQHALGMSIAEAEAVPTFYGRINSSDIAVQAGFLTFDAYGLQPLGATAPATINYSVFTGASGLFYSAGAWQTTGDLQLSLISGW